MDRRRFAPSAERLDDRLLLSVFSQPTNLPTATIQQRTLRIERLPVYLESLQPGRDLPADTVAALQDDIRSIVGKLGPPTDAAVTAFNLQLRSTISHASISVEDAAALRVRFGQVLLGAGAPAQAVESLQSHMDRLIQFDSTGREPAQLAANDYALILQTSLAVGRPIRTPPAPKLSPTDDDGVRGDRKTTVVQPHLAGNYDEGTTIQLLDENLKVIGTSAVAASGQYSVAPTSPLSEGKHTLRVRAVDPNNDFSAASKPIAITIKAPPRPRVPLATKSLPRGPLKS